MQRRIVLMLTDRTTGEVTFQGERVHRNLRCPICGKPDWCLIDQERGISICPRTPTGKMVGRAGYWHRIDGPRITPPTMQPAAAIVEWPTVDLERLYRTTVRTTRMEDWAGLALQWGVDRTAVASLAPGWDAARERWLFPMMGWTADGWNLVGLRVRQGKRKLAVTGSHHGLFIPFLRERPDLKSDLYVLEGESDTAAALSLGLQAVGRPGCLACVKELTRYAKGCHVVVVRDNDGPGRDGANMLVTALKPVARSVVAIQPPPTFKDFREWRAVLTGPAVVQAKVRGVRG